jgi:hypothetical protein
LYGRVVLPAETFRRYDIEVLYLAVKLNYLYYGKKGWPQSFSIDFFKLFRI